MDRLSRWGIPYLEATLSIYSFISPWGGSEQVQSGFGAKEKLYSALATSQAAPSRVISHALYLEPELGNAWVCIRPPRPPYPVVFLVNVKVGKVVLNL